jgi:hypothetical protein
LVAQAVALQSMLGNLSTLTVSQLVALFRQYQNVSGFVDLLKSAFPQIVMPHAQAAAQLTAQWFNELDPTGKITAAPTVSLPTQRIDKTVGWALNAPTGYTTPDDDTDEAWDGFVPQPILPTADKALARLAGSTKRMVFDASRDTVLANAKEHGWKWARYASANACAFCRVMASRGDVYSSRGVTVDPESGNYILTVTGRSGKKRGTQEIGDKYHDHCRCIAVPVPTGQTYTPPDYVGQWKQDYKAAFDAVPDGTSYRNNQVLKMVLAHMRANTDAH